MSYTDNTLNLIAAIVVAAFAAITVASLPDCPPAQEEANVSTDLIEWEKISSCSYEMKSSIYRTAVPNGWIVSSYRGHMTFVPDPEHEWLTND